MAFTGGSPAFQAFMGIMEAGLKPPTDEERIEEILNRPPRLLNAWEMPRSDWHLHDHPTKNTQFNRNGLTWYDWKEAAGVMGGDWASQLSKVFPKESKAWRNGEDPTEWKAAREHANRR